MSNPTHAPYQRQANVVVMESGVIYKALRKHFPDAWMHLQNSCVLGWEADFLCYVDKLYWCEVEVKVSRSDFKRDFTHKPEKHRLLESGFKSGRGHVYKGYQSSTFHFDLVNGRVQVPVTNLLIKKIPHRFYFACPEKLIQPSEIPKHYGLIWIDGEGKSKLVKRPKTLHKDRLMIMDQVAIKQHFVINDLLHINEHLKTELAKLRTL